MMHRRMAGSTWRSFAVMSVHLHGGTEETRDKPVRKTCVFLLKHKNNRARLSVQPTFIIYKDTFSCPCVSSLVNFDPFYGFS
jgi:hypothetical protein